MLSKTLSLYAHYGQPFCSTYCEYNIRIGHLLEDWRWVELSQRSSASQVQREHWRIRPARWHEEQRENESEADHCDLKPQNAAPTRVGHHDARY